jgi:hypothetical protein
MLEEQVAGWYWNLVVWNLLERLSYLLLFVQ